MRARSLDIALDSAEFAEIDVSDFSTEEIRAVTREDIYSFLLYAGQDRGNGNAAKSRKLSALKSFYKYLTVKRHIIEENPTADIDTPRRRSSLPKFLTLDESITLLEAIQNDTESKTIPRDYAMITLFLNCGMRLSELVGIDLNDIDPELRSLRVLGKGAKERIVYLNDACRSALTSYLRYRQATDETGLRTKALFLSSRGQRISVKTVQWVVYKYLKAAGLENRGFSVHKLRHTAATLMYQSGEVDVRVLKDILGHAQLNTTQIYTHVSDAHMEEAINRNPLSSVRAKTTPVLKKKESDDE